MHKRNKYSSPMYKSSKVQFRAVSIPKRVETQGKIVHGMQVHKKCKEPLRRGNVPDHNPKPS